MRKAVIIKEFPKETGATLEEITRYMEDYAKTHPKRQVFFDGDKYAVCYMKE